MIPQRKWCDLDDSRRYCKSINFSLAINDQHSYNVVFDSPLTEMGAVKILSEFLENPIDERWLQKVEDTAWKYREVKSGIIVRTGALIVDSGGNLTMIIHRIVG